VPRFLAWCTIAAVVSIMWGQGWVDVWAPSMMMVLGLILGEDAFTW
jgi:hypothetical protein